MDIAHNINNITHYSAGCRQLPCPFAVKHYFPGSVTMDKDSTGVDSTPIADGDAFELTLTTGW